MFLPFREALLMGGLLVVAVYSAFGFAALVDGMDRALVATNRQSPWMGTDGGWPASEKELIRRWDEQFETLQRTPVPPQASVSRESRGLLSDESLSTRNLATTSTALWSAVP